MKLIDLFEEELPNNFDGIVEIIERDCKPFLESGAKRLLFRGMRNKTKTMLKVNVRQDRKPKSMGVEMHNLADKWFDEKFGFKARSAAVFVTGDSSEAHDYGSLYAIFPIGDFKFVWSKKSSDLFVHLFDLASTIQKLEELNFKSTDLNDAIASGNEIMIHCKEYYAVSVDREQAEEYYKTLFERD
jgi:hypothetical protein